MSTRLAMIRIASCGACYVEDHTGTTSAKQAPRPAEFAEGSVTGVASANRRSLKRMIFASGAEDGATGRRQMGDYRRTFLVRARSS